MEEVVGYVIIGALAGMILGGIILGISVNTKKTNIGIGGFFACTLAGAIFGLIAAIPVFIIFCFAIRPDV